MRKFKLFVLLLGIFSFLGLNNVKATSGTTDVVIHYYLNGTEQTTKKVTLPGETVGGTLTYNPTLLVEEQPQQFMFWTVNGAVRKELPQNLTIRIPSKLVLEAHFASPTNKAAVFLDTNLRILGTHYAASGNAIPPADPTGQLAAFKGWISVDAPNYEAAIPLDTFPLNELKLFYVAKYQVSSSQIVTINGVEREINSVVTLTSELTNPVWKNANGQIVGYGQTFKFTALEAATLTPEASVAPAVDYVTFRGPITTIRTGYNSYVGSFNIGTKQIVDFGFILSDGTKAQSAVSNTIEGTNVNEFLMSFSTAKKQPVATYVSYMDGGVLVTKISTEAYTIAAARATGTGIIVEFAGVVTSVNGSNATVEDNTAAIYLFSMVPAGIEVGDKVIVKGERAVFNELIQISSGSVTCVSSGHSVPTVVEMVAFDNFADFMSKRVTVNNLVFERSEQGGRNIVFKLGSDNITLRAPGTTGPVFDKLATATKNHKVSVPSAILGWYNGAQFEVNSVDDFVITLMTDADKLGIIKNDMYGLFNNKQYNSGTTVDLPTTHPDYGGTINWTYNPSEAVVDNKWVAVGDQNITVTATANINLNGITGTQAVSILINYVEPGSEVEQLIYSTGFEASEEFTASTTYNNTTVKYSGPADKQWGTYYGTPSTNSAISGGQSMQMRWYTAAPDNLGYTFTNFDLSKITKVVFKAKNANGINVTVSVSNDGENWEAAETFILSTTATEYTYNVPELNRTTNMRVKFSISFVTAPTKRADLIIDDVSIYGMVLNP